MVDQHDGEITPLELWRILLARRVLILATLLACLVGALAYVLLATPRYEVEVHVDKPLASDITTLNLGRTFAVELRPYTVEEVFEYFTRELRSDRAFQVFFRDIYLPSLADGPAQEADPSRMYHAARKLLEVRVPDERGRGRNLHAVRMGAVDPALAVRWMEAFLDRVAREAKQRLLEDARTQVDLRVRNAQRELEQMRLTAAQERKDRLAELGEALAIAKSINLDDPQVSAVRVPQQDALAPFVDGSMLYARGVKSLSAELENLRSRVSDDPFVPGLRDAESRLRLLQEIEPDAHALAVYTMDGPIIVPPDPVWPRKSVVFGLAAAFGLFAGMALAIAVEFVSRGRSHRALA